MGEIYLAMGDKAKEREGLEKAVACRKEISDPKVKETEEKLKGVREKRFDGKGDEYVISNEECRMMKEKGEFRREKNSG